MARIGKNGASIGMAQSGTNGTSIISNDIIKKPTKTSGAVIGSNGLSGATAAATSGNYMPYDVIKTLMQSLSVSKEKGVDALNEAIQKSSNGKFRTAEEIVNKILADCEAAGDAEKFLRDYCGIVLDNDDTGAISGWDMGAGVVKTAESIVPEAGSRDTTFNADSFSVRGLTFQIGRWLDEENTTPISFNDLTDDQKFIWQSLYSYWADSALNLINNSYGGYAFTDSDVTVKEITLTFIRNTRSGELASTFYVDDDPADGTIDKLVLTINTAHYANFTDGDLNGISSSNQEYLDRTIAHELTHAIMNAKINYRYDLPMIITEGTAEITQGIDDVRGAELLKLAGDVNLLRQVLRLDKEYNTNVEGITAPDYSGGYIFLRYLAWQSVDLDSLGSTISNRSTNKTVYGSRFSDSISNISANVSIAGYELNDTITNSGTNVLIDAGDDNDVITNSGKNSTIIGGHGNDSINNTATDNLYRYEKGDGFDTITGVSAQDTLYVGTGDYSVSTNGSDKIVTLDDGSIIFTGAANTDFTIIDAHRYVILADGENHYNDYGNATILGNGSSSITNIGNGASLSVYGTATIANAGNETTIISGGGYDSIYNSGSNVLVDAGAGNDTIINNESNTRVTLTGGAGDDSIVNFSSATSKIEINAGYGNDTVYNAGNEVTITGGEGNDSIRNLGNVAQIFTAYENDSIQNSGSSVTIDAGDGDNWIYNDGSATISTGAGNDVLINNGADVQIASGGGNDNIRNTSLSGNDTIDAGDGSDTVQNYGSNVSIDTGADNDYISNNNNENVTLHGGAGNDTLYNISGNRAKVNGDDDDDVIYSNSDSSLVTISGGGGNDSINNWSRESSINAGAGNDTVVNSGNNVTIDAGAGNDTVYNAVESVFAELGAGSDTMNNYAANVTMDGGEDNDTLNNFASNVSINAGAGADYIYNHTSTNLVTVIGGSGDDTAYSSAAQSLLEMGSGNDSIMNLGNQTTVNGDAGDDFIYAHTAAGGSNEVLLLGGEGNDTLYSLGDNSTVDSGSGNDIISISGKNNTIVSAEGNTAIYLQTSSAKTYIRHGEGSDTVYGLKDNDTIEVEEGYTSREINGHIVINESLYLVNAAAVNFEIVTLSSFHVTLTEGADRFSNDRVGVKIYGLGGNDTINSTGANSAIYAGADNDSIKNIGANTTIDAGEGNNFINNDGIFTKISVGSGNDTIHNFGEGVLIEGDGTNNIQNSATSVTILTGEGNDIISNYRGRASILAGAGDNRIDNSSNAAESTIIAGSGSDTISNNAGKVLIDVDGGENRISNSGADVSINSGSGPDTISNQGDNVALNAGDGNNSITSWGNNVTITTGAGSDTISNHGTGNLIVYGGGNDVIVGLNAASTLKIDGAFEYEGHGTDARIKVGSGTITLKDAAGVEMNINGEKYISYEEAITLPAGISIDGDTLTADGDFTGNEISMADYGVAVVDAYGVTANGLSITGTDAANTLIGGAKNDTLTGGAGKDAFVYTAGADVITDYEAGETIYGGVLTGAAADGDDVVLAYDSNSLTVKNAVGKTITHVDETGAIISTIVSGAPTLPAGISVDGDSVVAGTAYTGGEINLADFTADFEVSNVDASALNKAISVSGDDNANILSGGKKNDTLTGGAGDDIFVYTAGADVITDYAAGDKIRFDSAIKSAAADGDDVIFTVGTTNKLTVQGAAGIEISYIDSDGEELTTILGGEVEPTLPAGISIDGDSVVAGTAYSGGEINLADFTADFEVSNVDASALNKAISVTGDDNANILSGGKKNDTLTGGAGDDIFVYTAGADVITDYAAGDKIRFDSAIKSAAADGDDVIFTVGTTNKLTVQGAAGIEISYIDSDGEELTTILGGEVEPTLPAGISIDGDSVVAGTAYTGGEINLADFTADFEVSNVDASALNKAISVTGDDNANILSGGKKNDTLTGGAGDDIFVYTAGADVITDYESGDKIRFDSAIKSAAANGDDVIFTVGTTNKLTVQGAAGIEISYIDSNGEELTTILGGEVEPTLPAGISIDGDSVVAGTAYTGGEINLADFTADFEVSNVDASALNKAISVTGDDNANILSGGKKNDTLTGGAGDDIFVYTAGADVITDYESGDKIRFDSAIKSAAANGDDVIFTVGTTNKLTVQGAAGIEISYIDSNGEELTTILGGEVEPTLPAGISIDGDSVVAGTAYTGSEINLADFTADFEVSNVDASALNKAISVTGDDNANILSGGKKNDTLTGGAGDDIFVYTAGADVITDYAAGDKIRFDSAIKSAAADGDDVIFTAGTTNKLTVQGAAGIEISYIDSDGDELTTILGGESGESLPAGLTISGDTLIANNDYTGEMIDLSAYEVSNVDASTLKAAISITGTDAANILVGGKGADTLDGVSGNDTLTGGSGKDIFVYSKGKVVITDYKEKQDKIQLTTGKVTNTLQSGLDMVFKIGTTNAITVGGGMNQAITIVGADGVETEYYAEATLPDGLTYASSTKKLTVATSYGGAEIGIATLPSGATATKTVDATKYSKALKITAASTAIAISGGTKANTITGGKAADTLTGGAGADKIYGEAGNDKIYGGKGNDLLEGGDGNDTIYGGGGNDTFTGGDGKDVFIYEGGKNVITDYTAGQDTLKISSGSVSNATLKSSDMLFTISGSGNNLTLKGAKDTEIAIGNVIYYNNVMYDSKKTTASLGAAFSGTLKAADYYSKTKTVNASNVSKAVYLNGNDAANSLLGGKGNDTLAGGKGNDTLTGGAGKDVFIYSAGNDVITDYVSGTDTIKLASGTIASASLKGSDMTFKVGSNTLTVKGVKDKEIAIGNVIYYNSVIYDSKKTTASLGSNFSGTLKAADYYNKTKTVDASNVSKKVYLNGNDAANSLLGGKGDDTLAGGKGNDTLTGGNGKDVFIYSAGNDVITDYVAGTDTIKLASGTIASASLKGSDMTFKVGSSTLTVKNGKDKDIAIGNVIYRNNLIYDSKKTGVTLGSGFSGNLAAADYDSKTKTIDASALTKAIAIVGNSQANTITGGKGNDTLTGGGGKDVFVYGAGKDVITDYTAGQDTIRIASGKITKTTYSGSDVIFAIGSGTLTVKNGNGAKISITDSSGKTTTETYSDAVSGSSSLWFTEDDDNFIGGETQLADISEVTADNYSVDKLSATDYQKLAQDEKTYIVSADK